MHCDAVARARRLCAALAIVVAAACGKDSTPPLVPTTMTVSLASFVLDAIGATQSLSAAVSDQNGAPMTGVTVTWTSSNPAVVTVTGGASATAAAVGNGSATLTATAGSVTRSSSVTVQQAPVAPVKLAGDAQSGVVGAALATLLRVRVQDRLGVAMAGLSVTFAAATGSGSFAPASIASGADGTASALWTLGTVAGSQSATVSVSGVSETATFSATATAGPAASMSVSAGNNQSAAVTTAVGTPPAVRVADAFNNPVAGVAVTFTPTAGSGSVTGGAATSNASGIAAVGSWTLGAIAGPQSLTASAAGLTSATFSATAVAGPPAVVVVSAGNNQTAVVSTQVNIAPAVRVTDAGGNSVSGVAVTFAVATGGGSVTAASTVTNSGGIATVGSWTVGPAAGANTLTATVTGTGITGNPVTFTATGTTSTAATFNIELRYLTAGTPSQVAAFTAAVARWQSIITADISSTAVIAGAGQCGSNSPAIEELIDDLVIYVTFEAIDGPGGTLGSAGPCFLRGSNGLPVLGRMRFDVADLAMLESQGLLNATILHEMGHVLGIGTIWDVPGYFAFLANPSLPSSPGVDTRFTGANGIAGFNTIGGTTYTLGGKVPVENTQGGAGTRDAHWRESVLANELMTGFISLSSNPLSVLTIRSLQDLGYTVTTAPADPFFLTLTAALRADSAASVELRNDLTRDPIRVIDSAGRVISVVNPPR